MKRNLLLSAMTLLAGSLLAADSSPADAVKNAVKKLSNADNYSWKSTVTVPEDSPFKPGPTEGKTEKGGYTLITTSFGDNQIESIMKGEKRAIKGQDGWQTPEEMAAARGGGAPGGAAPGGGRGRGGRGGFFGNAQPPAAQAEELVGKVTELKSADGAYSGDLTEEGAKSLVGFGGRGGGGGGAEVKGAKGSVKFWVKDGILTKYELKVKGSISFNGNDRDVDRTTTVEIKDVGKTKVEVPEEVKKKLS